MRAVCMVRAGGAGSWIVLREGPQVYCLRRYPNWGSTDARLIGAYRRLPDALDGYARHTSNRARIDTHAVRRVAARLRLEVGGS